MKKTKQIISLLLSAIMILTAFAGCADSSDEPDSPESPKEDITVLEEFDYDSEEDEIKEEEEEYEPGNTIENISDKPASPTVSGPTLPSPDAYFNNQLARNEDKYIEEYGYHCLSYKTDFDNQQAMQDYVALLSQDKYQLELTDEQDETVYYLRNLRYSFTYTGTEDVPEIYNEHNDISGDLLVFIQHNSQSSTVLMTLYFKPDAFEFKDFGDRTSYIMEDLSGNSNSNSGSNPGSELTTKSNFDCFDCDGTGDCQECGGNGFVWSSATDSERRDCNKCMFNKGKCNTCKGSGRR